MASERSENEPANLDAAPHFAAEPEPADVQAWEQIEVGRYMPRRIKGSCKGRALG